MAVGGSRRKRRQPPRPPFLTMALLSLLPVVPHRRPALRPAGHHPPWPHHAGRRFLQPHPAGPGQAHGRAAGGSGHSPGGGGTRGAAAAAAASAAAQLQLRAWAGWVPSPPHVVCPKTEGACSATDVASEEQPRPRRCWGGRAWRVLGGSDAGTGRRRGVLAEAFLRQPRTVLLLRHCPPADVEHQGIASVDGEEPQGARS